MACLMPTFQSHQDRSWKTVAPGVEFCVLRPHGSQGTGDGMTLLVRMAAGADAQLHDHAGGEETYIVSGKMRIGTRELVAGDYLWTAPGEPHDGHAHVETVFFVVLPAGLQVLA